MKNQEEIMNLISQIFDAIQDDDMESDICEECGNEDCMCDDMDYDEEDEYDDEDPMKKGFSITMIKKSKKNPFTEED